VKEVLKDYMQDNSKPMIFMLPINLRAEIIQNDNRGNDVSFIDIKVNKDRVQVIFIARLYPN
jgi:hypothetical protein